MHLPSVTDATQAVEILPNFVTHVEAFARGHFRYPVTQLVVEWNSHRRPFADQVIWVNGVPDCRTV
jgi:hypothetical protein